MRYLIVGGSIAGLNAVEAIRRLDSRGEIVLVSEENEPPYSRPLISHWLADQQCERQLYRPADFYRQMKVKLYLGVKAARLDPAQKRLLLATGQELTYDRLLLACGGTPIVPAFEGKEGIRTHSFFTWQDARSLAAVARRGERALVVGGGLIGLKAAESLKELGLEVAVAELGSQILGSILPQKVAAILTQLLVGQGLEFYLNQTITKVEKAGKQIDCYLDSLKLRVDQLVLAVGVRPNLELCQGTGLETKRGILVNEKQQTNLTDIYAAGDVTESIEPLTGQRRVMAILPHAARQGRIAGAVMAGGSCPSQTGIVFNSITILGHNIVTMGLTGEREDSENETIDYDRKTQQLTQLRWQGKRIIGAVLLNRPERSGIYRQLIEQKVELPEVGYVQPSFLSLPQEAWPDDETQQPAGRGCDHGTDH